MGHPAAAAARALRHGLRDRFPSFLAATLLVVPILIFAASLPRPVRGDPTPTLVFTTSPTSIVAGETSGVITVQRQDGAGTPTTDGSLTVDLTSNSATGVFRDAGDTTNIPSVIIPDTEDSASFLYTDTATPGANLTAADEANVLTSAVQAITVTPAALDHFTITNTILDQAAGTPFEVDATAYDQYGNVQTDYPGGAGIKHDLADSPGCASCSPVLNAQAPDYGTFATWVDGQSSVDVIANNAQAGVRVTIEDGLITSAPSNIFGVEPSATLGGFTIDNTILNQAAGTPFEVDATAYDQYGNVKSDYAGSASITHDLADSPGCASCTPVLDAQAPDYGTFVAWSSGQSSVDVTAFNAQAGVSVTVEDGTITSASSNSFAVANGAALGGFTITTSAPATKTAGTSFTTDVVAYDLYGNTNKTYGATPTLSMPDSPGCAACSSALPIAHPSYGTLTFTDGSASASVTPVKAEGASPLTVTDSGAGVSNTTSVDVANAAALGGFTIDNAIGAQIAGTAFAVNATAYDPYGNVKKDYAGSAGIKHDLASSPGCASCSPVLAVQAPNYGTFAAWPNGQSSVNVIAYNAQLVVSVTVEDGSIHSAASNGFAVSNAVALGGFTIDNTIGAQVAGTAFTVNATAYDPYGNVKADYAGSAGVKHNLASSPGCSTCSPVLAIQTPDYGTFATWGGGQSSVNVIAYNAQAAVSVTVEDSSIHSAASNGFAVSSAAALGGFTITTSAPTTKTAGTGFTANVTAFDLYGNVNKTYAGVPVLSGLANSPGCAACTPLLPVTSATYGSPLSFSNGLASATVTAFKAQATATLMVTDSGASVSNSTSFNVAPAAALSGFTIDNVIISPRTAGSAFTVNATAYDPYGNAKTNYGGGATVTGNLNPSPGFLPSTSDDTPPLYGAFGSWTTGSASAQVTGFKAETLRTVRVIHASIQSALSNTFTVQPAAPAIIHFSDSNAGFNGQPYDTKKDTPIYSTCVRATSGTLPCDATTSTKVKVLVRDAYGNLVLDNTSISIAASTRPSGSTLTGTTTALTTAGVATFGTPTALVVTPVGTTGGVQFTASLTVAGAAAPVISNLFQLVNDLETCTGTLCDNLFVASPQSAYDRIVPGSSTLNGVTLTTQQLSSNQASCVGMGTQVGATTDIRVQGFPGSVSSARPKFTVALIISKATLQANHLTSRDQDKFNICLGTTWEGGGEKPPTNSSVPVWRQKQITKQVPQLAQPDTAPSPDVYWGWLPDCSKSLPSTNPCILERTKEAHDLQKRLGLSDSAFKALNFKDGDLAIVWVTQTPWDAKGSIF